MDLSDSQPKGFTANKSNSRTPRQLLFRRFKLQRHWRCAATMAVLVLFLLYCHIYTTQLSSVSFNNMVPATAPGAPAPQVWVRRLPNRDVMYEDVRHLLPAEPVVMEVGVWKGGNAASLLRMLQPGRLILSDLWAETSDARYKAANEYLVRRRFEQEIAAGIVEVRKGRSIDQIRHMANGSIDMFYLDTVHDFRLTIEELRRAERVVAPRGLLCGHDFVQPRGKEIFYGVIAAVVEFALHHKWTLTHVSMEESRSFCMQRLSAVL